MNPKKIIGIIVPILFCILLFTTSVRAFSVDAVPVDDNNNPVDKLDENAAKAKITYTGLSPYAEYKLCGMWHNPFDFDRCSGSEGGEVRLYTDGSGKATAYACGDLWESAGTPIGIGETILGLKFDVDAEYRKDHKAVKNCGPGDYFHYHNYSYQLKKSDDSRISGGNSNLNVEAYFPDIKVTSAGATPDKPTPNDKLTITITGGRRPYTNRNNRNKYKFDLQNNDSAANKPSNPSDLQVSDGVNGTGSVEFGPLSTSIYTLAVEGKWDDTPNPLQTFTIIIEPNGGSITDNRKNTRGAGVKGQNPCQDLKTGSITACKTALGNIPTDIKSFSGKILEVAIGLAGGIALIFMVYGSIKILTSSGDPKKVAEGREIIVAAIAGTLFLILSVLILRFIGATFLPTNPFS